MVELVSTPTNYQAGDAALVNRGGQPAMISLSPVVSSGSYSDLTNTPFFRYDSIFDLLISGETSRGVGEIWEAGGFRYEEVTSGEHITTAPGGVKLKVLPKPDGYSVKPFGVVGDGVVDDTVAVQKAVNAAYGGVLNFSGGTVLMGSVTIGDDIELRGHGTTILRPAGFDPNNVSELTAGLAHFDITHPDAKVSISGFTFDGQEDLQTTGNPSGISIRYADVSGATTGSGHIRIYGNKFIDQTLYAVMLSGLTSSNEQQFVSIYENEFLDGRYGIGKDDPASPNVNGFTPFSIQITDHISARIYDNTFAFRKTVTTGQYAPSGVRLSYLNNTINADGPSATITGNSFYRMGRSDVYYTGATSTQNNGLGAVDFYARGKEVVVSNNRFDGCLNSGVRGKANIIGVSVTGNVLVDTPLAINIGPATAEEQVGTVTITGNVITHSDQFGISVIGNNALTNPTVDGVTISGNSINGVDNVFAVTGNIAGIIVRNAKNVTICGNAVRSTSGGVHGIISRNCVDVVVSDNTLYDISGDGVFIESPTEAFTITGNMARAITGRAYVTVSTTTSEIGSFIGNICDGAADYGILNLSAIGPVSIIGNVLKDISGLSRGVFLHSSSSIATVSGNITDATTPSFYSGARHNIREVGNSWNRSWTTGTIAPTSGTWAVGDILWLNAPTAGGWIGWVCVTAGTPGTWKRFGAVEP